MVVSVQEYDDEGELTAEFLSTTPHYLAISVHQPRNYGNPTSHQLSHPQKRHHSSMTEGELTEPGRYKERVREVLVQLVRHCAVRLIRGMSHGS